MSRCQHNQKITKFCITPTCNHFTSGGCQYCFKRYHCHLGQSKFVKQTQICDIIKYLTSFQDKKPKIRPLKQSIYNYFNIIKGQLSTYLDCLSSDLLNKVTYSYMIKSDSFNVFKKLKQKQYNKLTSSDLINLIDFKNKNDTKQLQKNQLRQYITSAEQVYNKINKINNLYKQFQNQTSGSYLGQTIMSVSIFYKKITDIYQFIHKQKQSQQDHYKKSLDNKKDQLLQNHYQKGIKDLKKNIKVNQDYNNSSSSNSDQKVKQFIQNKFKPQDEKKMSSIIAQQVKETSILRPRKVSIDSRCNDLVGKSKLKTFQQKQKQIIERKKRLQQIMSLSEKKKQPENVQSSSGTSSNDANDSKNQQGYYSQNQKAFQKKNQKVHKDNDQNMMAYKLLPVGKEDKRLYEQQQSVQKKTLKIPVNVIQQHAEDQQCQSPILRLKKSEKPKPTTGSSGFQLGLFKVHSTSEQTHSEPIHPEVQVQSSQLSSGSDKQNIKPIQIQKPVNMNISQNQTSSLYLLIQSLKVSGKKAIPLLQAALKYAPNNFSAVQYLTFLLLQQNQPKQCLRVCNEALKIIAGEPNGMEISFHLFNNKAAALNMLGRFSESIQILQRCLQVCKKDILYKNLGDAYFSLGIIEKAIINYQNTLILNDQSHEALFNLAVCLFTQKNYDSAKLKVQRALMIDQKNQNYIDLYKQIGYALKNV